MTSALVSKLRFARRAVSRSIATFPALLVLALASCTQGDPSGPPQQQVQLGALTITIVGVPDGVQATITVSGPGGTKTVVGSATLSGLAAGTYTITASNINNGGHIFAPSPATQSVSVAAGATGVASTIGYSLVTGSLTVGFGGLPSGTPAAIVIAGPGGYGRAVSSPTSIAGLIPGVYSIEARPVQAGGFTYEAIVPLVTVDVAAVTSASTASFTYALASGALTVTVQGLPSGNAASVRITGPAGYLNTVTATTTLTDLEPGTYTLTGDPVVIGPDTWSVPQPVTVDVSATETPAGATLTYGLATGRLTISSSGQPGGSNPVFQVTGPGGFATSVSSGATLTGLAPGTYTVVAPTVSTGTATYAPTPASQQVAVPASSTPTQATVTYAIATGSLTVTISGLPQTVQGSVTVTGPGGFQANLSGSATLNNLTPGVYAIAASSATAGVHVYSPSPTTQNAAVAASQTPATAPVTYALASGLISVAVNGLPAGTNAAVTVTGPGGYSAVVTGTTLLTGLMPGAYQVAAANVGSGPVYVPTPANQGLVVNASTVAVPVTVTYLQATGTLIVTISGLPGGLPASVNVDGPGGYSAALTAGQSLIVPVGTYTVTAQSVSQSGTTYNPAPTSQNAAVALGTATNATVTYTGTLPSGLNLLIDGAYITQSVQTYSNSVPLVSGRNALVRVFVKASEANSAQPSVRVRFYDGITLVNTVVIPAPSASVPLSVTEGTLNSSWNASIAGSLLQPGLSMLVDVDPGDAVVESIEGDNNWPTSGTPASLDVRALPTLDIRFVPIHQSSNGLIGNVSEANKATYLAPMEKMFPLSAIDADVHATYTTSAAPLASGGGNWSGVLSEIYALRVAESSTRSYYGVVKVSYTSGVAGLGYIALPASMGWDHLPSGAEVMAHELGHNFGRYHAPCGGPSGVDPSYPYSGAVIGAYGYDIFTGVLKAPTLKDLMSYCDPAWISDYNYNAILTYRESSDQSSARVVGALGRSLLVWGRVESGRLVLEPAFEIDAPASLPGRPGPNRIEGFGPSGQLLFSIPFTGMPVADAPDPNEQTFAFAIPLDMLRGVPLQRLRFSALGRQVELGAPAATPAGDIPSAVRTVAGRVRVKWNAAMRGALIRNARTGQVLAISRGASVDVPATNDDLDVALSDGVRSVKQRIKPQR